MINTKLIFAAGMSGSGKSTTAQNISLQLERQGIAHTWLHSKRPRRCISFKSAVALPEYWNTGVFLLLLDEARVKAQAKGYTWVDMSITSADNPHTTIFADHMGCETYKVWQVYRKDVGGV